MNLLDQLLGVPSHLLREGSIGLKAGPVEWLLVLLAAGVGGWLVVQYRRSTPEEKPRGALIGLRCVALFVLLLLLLRPVLRLESVVPQETFVALLADDSLSMTVPDGVDGSARGDWIRTELGEGGQALARLQERFRTRSFAFGADGRQVNDLTQLSFADRRSGIAAGLETVSEELAGVPLSGVVLLSDGADSTPASELTERLLQLRAAGVKVFPVGLGEAALRPDVEVSRLELPRRALLGGGIEANVEVVANGMAGQEARLELLDDGVLVGESELQLPADGDVVRTPVEVVPREVGVRRITARIATADGELLAANNETTQLLEVTGDRQKILYFEGEPRYEVAFLRRAVARDDALQLVSLVRLSDNRFSRLEVDDADELAGGFPTSREELFSYRAIVLGSVEASFFTYEQMRMLLEFVGTRGGGVLFLGGANAFGEGGYSGTPVDEVIPIEMRNPSADGEFFTMLKVQPTPAGRRHPVLQLGVDAEGGWNDLPELSSRNRAVDVKPGASSLLTARSDQGGEQIVLAHQRYGRGRSVALTAQDSWKWQMKLPLEDETHELFWRQVLRWLVSEVPDQVQLEPAERRAQLGERLPVRARIRDAEFAELNDAQVRLVVTDPDGEFVDLPMEWGVVEDGLYEGGVELTRPGLHKLELRVRHEGGELPGATEWVDSADLDREFFRAGRRDELLRRIADETGGEVYGPQRFDRLIDQLTYSQEGVTVREERLLGHAPILYLLLLGALSAEWLLRRREGLR